MAELYGIADVFANCSHEDTLPTVNLESQSCGTPVVSYNNTGLKESTHPEYGLSIETDNIDSFVSALKSMKGRKEIVAGELREWIKLNFDINRNYLEYINLYKEIK